MDEVTRTVKLLRADRGWSQTRLARESGLSRVTINTLERNKSTPTVDTAEKIATAFGLTLAEFWALAPDATDPDKPP